LVIEKWLNITTSFLTYICASTGKETSASGSTKPVANIEDFRPEELKLQPFHPDLLIGLDLQLDAKLSGIITDPESAKDSPLLKSDLLVSECNSPNPLESLSITEERTEVRRVLKPTNSVLLTISANWFYIPEWKESMLPKPKLAFLTILLR
jgi:hypothetical protein